MTEDKLDKIYRILRVAIFALPVIAVITGLYLILFPVDSYNYFPDDPKFSKFEVERDNDKNRFLFGIVPVRDYRFIILTAALSDFQVDNCSLANAKVYLKKTYRAFDYPTADAISDEEKLRSIIFENNKTKYPNGSLLHLKPTNEVFVILEGKKILFPGPEIFEAFGYSFDNLIDVDKSEIDLYPDAEQRVFSWSKPHPDGTIFISYPSHSLFIVADGKKMSIEKEELLRKVSPNFHPIVVSDPSIKNSLDCSDLDKDDKIECRFDSQKISSIGRYYSFSFVLPGNCSIEPFQPGRIKISFVSDRTWSTAKESMRTIAASVFNRYFFKEQ